MSDQTPTLTVPAAGWYPDRNAPGSLRWWDGAQWTDHVKEVAPSAAATVVEPVSVEAFRLQPVAPSIPAGWYVDRSDASIRRWWDGSQWTAHTTTAAGLATGGVTGAPAVNSLATRGLAYSLIALVINPFLMMSIGGLVNGIRALRRVPQFPVEAARRGSAIAAIVIGSAGTALGILLVVAAITTAVSQANRIHWDQSLVQSQLRGQISEQTGEEVARVDCPAQPTVMTFSCEATLVTGEVWPIRISMLSDRAHYNWSVDTDDTSDSTTT